MAEKTDITFEICDVIVNVRAVAIIINNGCVLFQKKENDLVWALPGGKIAIMEKGNETIKRELREEIGEEVEVSELFDVRENFFTYNNKGFHEYMFLYFAKLKNDSKLKNNKFFDGVEVNKHLKFVWLNSKELEEYNVVPVDIIGMLRDIIGEKNGKLGMSRVRRGRI